MGTKEKLYAVGANIFAGGFTLGVRQHFEVLAHLEHEDKYGAEVSHRNLGVPIYAPDPSQPPLDAWPRKFPRRVDLLYSNPPCAVWSTLGGAAQRGFDWRLDPRLQRVRDIFALAARYKPKVWCWESVCGAFTKGREFVDELVASAAKQGYAATFVFIDAQWHGIPQTRKRFFLVLHKVAIDWRAPNFEAKVHAYDVIKKVRPKRMGDVNPKRGTPLAKLIASAKPGEPLAKTYDRIHGDDPPKNKRGQALGRLARSARRLGLDGASGAVVSPWLWHPKEHRQLSLEEFGALTGFPKDYEWAERGKPLRHDPAVRLMARGVMPPVAEWLASNFATAIRAGKRAKPEVRFADFRVPPGVVDLATAIEAPPWKDPRVKGAKAARVKGPPRVKQPPVDYARLVAPPVPRSALNLETSGEFIRHLLRLGRFSDPELAAMTRRAYDGRKTTTSDVAWNRGRLKKAGIDAPRVAKPIAYETRQERPRRKATV